MRRGLIFGILLFILITVAWWFLLLSGKSAEIGEFEDQTATAKIEQQTLEARRNELQALAAKEGDYLLALGEIQNSIPAFPDGAALIEDLNNIALETGVDLLTLSPSPPAASTVEGLFEITTIVRFEAPYFKVLGVLFAIEDLERLVRVDQISVEAALDEDGTNILTVNLTATAFSQTGLAAAGVDAGTGEATTGEATDTGEGDGE